MALTMQLRAVWSTTTLQPELNVALRENAFRTTFTQCMFEPYSYYPHIVVKQGLPRTIAALTRLWVDKIGRPVLNHWQLQRRGRRGDAAARIRWKLQQVRSESTRAEEKDVVIEALIAPVIRLEEAARPDLREFYADWTLVFGRYFPGIEITFAVEDELARMCRFGIGTDTAELRIED